MLRLIGFNRSFKFVALEHSNYYETTLIVYHCFVFLMSFRGGLRPSETMQIYVRPMNTNIKHVTCDEDR